MRAPETRSYRFSAISRISFIWLLSVGSGLLPVSTTIHAGENSIKTLSSIVGIGTAARMGMSRGLLDDEVSIKTGATQGVEINDNILLSENPPGGLAIRSTTDFSGSIMTGNQTQDYELQARAGVVEVGGPGDPGNLDSAFGDNIFFSTRFHKQRKRFSFNLRSSQSRQNAAEAQSRDSTIPVFSDDDTTDGIVLGEGFTTVDSDQESFTVGGDFTAEINRRNSLTFSANATQQSFSGGNRGNLVDSESITTSGSWTNRRSEKTSLTGTVNHLLFKPSDRSKSHRVETTGSISSRISRRLNVNASAGASFVNGGTGSNTNSGNSTGFTGDFGLAYSLKRTTVSLNVSSRVSPTSTGVLSKSESARIQINHDINHRSGIGVYAKYAEQKTSSSSSAAPGSITSRSTRKLFTISPNYSITLNRKWSSNMEYEFAYQDKNAGTGVAKSNSVFVSFRRNLPARR